MNQPLWQYILTTSLSFAGSGLAAAVVGAYFKREFDIALEREKASLARATSVHTLQMQALNDIHVRLTRINSDLASWALRLSLGETTVDLSQKIIEQRNQAMEAFQSVRLLVPKDIGFAVDQYFSQGLWVDKALLKLQLYNISPGPQPRADFSETYGNVNDLIYGPLQALINSIDDRSRKLIHGDSTQ
jgi:hypothetical protein